MNNNPVYKELIDDSNEIAISAFENFLKLLGIDLTLFKNIYQIPIIIEVLPKKIDCQYDAIKNRIIFSKKKLEELCEEINRKRVLLDIASDLVHERNHANRSMYIKGGLNILSLKNKCKEEFIRISQEKKGHDLNQYRVLLSDELSKPYTKYFECYIPIKIIYNENKTCTVIVYNKRTKNYEVFSNRNFDISSNEIFYEIGKILNDNINEIKSDDTIFSFIEEVKSLGFTVADYYHQYNGRLLNKNEIIDIDNIETSLNEKAKEIRIRLKGQRAFEETIIEALSNIIIMTRNDNTLDLYKVAKRIENLEPGRVREDVRIGAKFIRIMGVDILRWFMTSTFDLYYDDKFYSIFQDKYDVLLRAFVDIYETSENDEKLNQSSIDDIDSILEEKLIRKQKQNHC